MAHLTQDLHLSQQALSVFIVLDSVLVQDLHSHSFVGQGMQSLLDHPEGALPDGLPQSVMAHPTRLFLGWIAQRHRLIQLLFLGPFRDARLLLHRNIIECIQLSILATLDVQRAMIRNTVTYEICPERVLRCLYKRARPRCSPLYSFPRSPTCLECLGSTRVCWLSSQLECGYHPCTAGIPNVEALRSTTSSGT